MTRITSDTVQVPASSTDVFNFLQDLRNYEQLMPPMVNGFRATGSSADFSISGLGQVHVDITKAIPGQLIELSPSGKLPFAFKLFWELSESETGTAVTAVADAELNMVMKMVAEPQLRKFVQAQAETLLSFFTNQNPAP